MTGSIVTSSPTNDTVMLDWTSYNQWLVGDIARFDIYFTDHAFDSVTGMTPVMSVGAGGVTATFTGLAALQDHYFAIVPVDALGNYSPAVTNFPRYGLGVRRRWFRADKE